MTPTPATSATGRRTFLRNALALAPLLALPPAMLGRPLSAAAALSDQDMADLARIEQYMDSITTMSARFQQIEPGGRLAFGNIYLRKPGRLRVEYDTMPISVIADGTLISYYDMELDQLSQLPLRQSTAWFLVRHPINLSNGITVSQIDRSPGGLQLQMFQTNEPDAGSVSLIFYENPLTLAQWTVTDAQNKEVRVGLTNVRTGIPIPNEKFQTPRTCRQTDSCIGGRGSRGGGKD